MRPADARQPPAYHISDVGRLAAAGAEHYRSLVAAEGRCRVLAEYVHVLEARLRDAGLQPPDDPAVRAVLALGRSRL